MPDFDQTVRARRSVRAFRSTPVAEALVRECLELAQTTPSNCNVQPWRVFVASGAARDRLSAHLVEAVKRNVMGEYEDPIDTFPGEYRAKQVACAVEMYGNMGVGRGDTEGRFRANLRNYELFDAPHVAIVCMDESFGLGVALDVGMWVQTFMLALASRGIGSCAQASLRAYPAVLRAELGIPDSLRVLCGVAFGYEDETAQVNRTKQPRDAIEANVVFRSE